MTEGVGVWECGSTGVDSPTRANDTSNSSVEQDRAEGEVSVCGSVLGACMRSSVDVFALADGTEAMLLQCPNGILMVDTWNLWHAQVTTSISRTTAPFTNSSRAT